MMVKLFGDTVIAGKILKTPDPRKQKALGRRTGPAKICSVTTEVKWELVLKYPDEFAGVKKG